MDASQAIAKPRKWMLTFVSMTEREIPPATGLSNDWSLGEGLFIELYLEQFGPVFSGHKQPVRLCIIGDAVRDRLAVRCTRLRGQRRQVDEVLDHAGRGIDA